ASKIKATPAPHLLKGKVVASCFFEASTRTRLSFETAVQRLGGSVIGFADSNSTSAGKKGETLADSMQIISSYADAVVIRHPKDGAARLAAKFTGNVPVINAGDGANQHPSQTLLDLFTIYETQQRLDNLHIAMVGDLKYGRTVHSLSQALAKFSNNHFYFISPNALAMPDHILQQLQQNGQSYSQHTSIEQVLPQLDILYMTRVQRERLDESEYQHIKSAFILDLPKLVHAKPNLKVLHPLPRVDEIDTMVDSTSHAYYFTQAQNGVYARQALLAMILNGSI
ncbi:MAG: aspartate carbamoyltransferase, partial [Vibrionaceae bacterium]